MNLSLIDLSLIDVLGFVAALSVLASFCMTTKLALRSFALLSNVLFIVYGLLSQVYPVFFLHLVLLPLTSQAPPASDGDQYRCRTSATASERNKLACPMKPGNTLAPAREAAKLSAPRTKAPLLHAGDALTPARPR